MTFTRGQFIFDDDGKLADMTVNLVAWDRMIEELQALENDGPDDTTERAHLIVEKMIEWGALDPKKRA